MPSSLLPERPLIVSPTLAETIGLEEAVMVHVFGELLKQQQPTVKNNRKWIELTDQQFQQACPFWAPVDINRIKSSLQAMGLLLIDPQTDRADSYRYAIDEADERSGQPNIVSAKAVQVQQDTNVLVDDFRPTEQVSSGGNWQSKEQSQSYGYAQDGQKASQVKPGTASYMSRGWQPDQTWLNQCRQQGIPAEFARDLVPTFVKYWLDRGQSRFSWGNAFYKHAIKEWRQEQSRKQGYDLHSEMTQDWVPSPDAIEILANAGVSLSFMEDAIPEFVLYWRERGVTHGAWNTRFIEHIRRQWTKFSVSFGNDGTPRPITGDWQPSPDCLEIIQLAEIDEAYARSKVPEFVLYWKENGQTKASWNTTFLQFIKQDWARRLKKQQATEIENAENHSLTGANSQRVKDRFQRIADRSWAS